MPVKCAFDSCAGICWLLVWQFHSQSWKIVKNRKNFGKKLSNLCSGDAKRSFVKSAEKRTSAVEFFCAINPKRIQKVFFENFVLFPKWFSAHLECRSDGRAERFQPLSDTSFSLKSKNYVRTVTFFSGEPNSHQMIACTRELHFWQLRRNICAKSVDFLI